MLADAVGKILKRRLMILQQRIEDILYVDVQISNAVEMNTTTSNSVQNIFFVIYISYLS